MEQKQLEPLLITQAQAADLLGVSMRTVHNLSAANELPSRRIGRRRMIPYSALTQLIRRDARTRLEHMGSANDQAKIL